ncbi:DNA-methyltransferase [Propionivibrio sp.]|uniref:DNA-methyltransferase n=1 Tax=Propionivibrio sp. TaxID=2212460 RepID=UPI003BF1F147
MPDSRYTLHLGDCLERMAEIPDGSVDMILCDLPYGTTACKWDSVIPFEPLWAHYKRVIKKSGAIVLTASQPFTTKLISSNMKDFRYEWIWDKYTPTGFLNVRRMPLKQHENIAVFYEKLPTYNPQKYKKPYLAARTGKGFTKEGDDIKSGVYGSGLVNGSGFRSEYAHPKTIIYQPTGNGLDKKNNVHPTQKPVALMEYLIRTYTNEGETVLDNTMGSGTTGVACINTGRKFIGIERDDKYFAIAKARIEAAIASPVQAGLFGQAA